MREWFDLCRLEGIYKQMGCEKVSHMEIFESLIIQKMSPYFEPLFPGFHTLRNAVFPPRREYIDSPINHDAIITIFNDILSGLPGEHRVATPIPIQPKQGIKYTHEFIQCFYGLDPDIH